jgi:hypothetical protein
MHIDEYWDDEVKLNNKKNKEAVIAQLQWEFGLRDFDRKLVDFCAMGPFPFSIISYHNEFLTQSRNSFVQGAYYPSLTAACALGERILNHLILDLRQYFISAPGYDKVGRDSAFRNWPIMINPLEEWGVLRPEAVTAFRKLEGLRHKSIHFSPKTYDSLREDALAALLYLGRAIGTQFCADGFQPWFIEGTKGAFFIKKDYETDPFVKSYYINACPHVGVCYAYAHEGAWRLFDFRHYEGQELTDQEFCELFNNRDMNKSAPTNYPCAENIICYEWPSRRS